MPKKQEIVPLGDLHICRPPTLTYTTGSEQGFQLMSDLHLGARNTDEGLIKEELEHARKHKDRIAINGDVLDLILVQDKKRFRADVLHPRLHGKVDIVTPAIEWAVSLLKPYADQIDMIGLGNHEAFVEKHCGYDPLRMIVYELRKHRKTQPPQLLHYGGYTGFIDYRHRSAKTTNNRDTHCKRFIIYYHHGSGGSAPVTRGMISLSRMSWVGNAHIQWQGHRHWRVSTSSLMVSCPMIGDEPLIHEVRQVMSGAYFDTYRGQSQKSVDENGRITNYASDFACQPQGKGGARVVLTFGHTDEPFQLRVIQ